MLTLPKLGRGVGSRAYLCAIVSSHQAKDMNRQHMILEPLRPVRRPSFGLTLAPGLGPKIHLDRTGVSLNETKLMMGPTR